MRDLFALLGLCILFALFESNIKSGIHSLTHMIGYTVDVKVIKLKPNPEHLK